MSAQLVIEHIAKKQGINFNTLADKDFSQLSWLTQKEPIYNIKGEKIAKSYYYKNQKEAIRIEYFKIFETYKNIENVFVGIKKQIHWIDWAGNIGKTKNLQPYYFNLQPVFLGDGTETIVGFSSPKMRSILKNERYNADDYLQAQNPKLYALIYNNYKNEYNNYLLTGVSKLLVERLNNETDTQILQVLNNNVYETNITVKQLIISTLQDNKVN